MCYDRGDLIQTILDDIMPLTKSSTSNKSRLTPKGVFLGSSYKIRRSAECIHQSLDVAQALLAVKSLGKQPAGSQVVASRQNLTSLLAIYHAFKEDAEASNEALKCIANALLLIESARSSFVQKEIGGGDAVVEILEVCA